MLDKTLKEEEETDSLLTDIAENYINVEAEQLGEYVWETETKEKRYYSECILEDGGTYFIPRYLTVRGHS